MPIPSFFFGDSVNFVVQFTPPLLTTDPTATVSWSVVDASGVAPDASYSNRPETISSDATSYGFSIPPSVNTKTGSGSTEFRYARVSWPGVAGTFYADFSYILISRTPITIFTDDVRGAYGLNEDELPDSDIDLQAAITQCRAVLTSAVFDAALIAGDQTTIQVNNAIKYRAALDLAPSLKLRAARMAASDSSKFQRFDVDFDSIVQGIQNAYDRSVEALLPDGSQTGVVPLIFTTAASADELFSGG